MPSWNPMKWIFGKSLTPEQMLRKNQQALNRAMRNIDRERLHMEQQEKKLIVDLKKMAKENQMDAVKIIAKDIAHTRRYIKKFMLMKANIQAVSMKIASLRSQNAVSTAMTQVTIAMRNMNQQLQLPQIQRILQEFEKQSITMDMKEEIMSEAIDDAMGETEDEDETDGLVAQIFDELGLQLKDQLSELPEAKGKLPNGHKSQISAGAAAAAASLAGGGGSGNSIDDLQARLDELRRDDNDFPEFPKTP